MSNFNQGGSSPPTKDPFSSLVSRFGKPSHREEACGVKLAAFSLSDAGDTVLCDRRATPRAGVGRDIDAMLAHAAAAGLSPKVIVASVGDGLRPYAHRPDLHLVKNVVAELSLRAVLWSRIDAISRNPECALEHLTAVVHRGAGLHLAGTGQVDELTLSVLTQTASDMECGCR